MSIWNSFLTYEITLQYSGGHSKEKHCWSVCIQHYSLHCLVCQSTIHTTQQSVNVRQLHSTTSWIHSHMQLTYSHYNATSTALTITAWFCATTCCINVQYNSHSTRLQPSYLLIYLYLSSGFIMSANSVLTATSVCLFVMHKITNHRKVD